MKKFCFFALFAAALSLQPLEALAHRVSVFAWVDGDTVHTESKFSGGKAVKEGIVKVFDASGNLLLEGATDENGEFSFQTPAKEDLRIELAAGAGHGNEWVIKASEFGVPETAAADAPPEPTPPADAVSPEKQTVAAEPSFSGEQIELAVEQAVEKALDRKLKPVMKMLSDLSDPGPTMKDIVGGIGYIVGLVGIGAYFSGRKNRS